MDKSSYWTSEIVIYFTIFSVELTDFFFFFFLISSKREWHLSPWQLSSCPQTSMLQWHQSTGGPRSSVFPIVSMVTSIKRRWTWAMSKGKGLEIIFLQKQSTRHVVTTAAGDGNPEHGCELSQRIFSRSHNTTQEITSLEELNPVIQRLMCLKDVVNDISVYRLN